MAAYYLASAGWDVLLLEKAQFPRRKVCGGGLTHRGIMEIPYDITPMIHQTVHRGFLGFRGQKVCAIQNNLPIAYLIERSSFDDYLRQKAVEKGVSCHQGERVTGISQTSDGVTLQTEKSNYTARFATGADSVHSLIAKQLGLLPNRTTSLAMEARLTLPADRLSSLTDTITFDFGALYGGYGWIFPKLDHLNVGIFRNWPGKRATRQQLLRFIHQRSGLEQTQILDIRAYPGPVGGDGGPRHSDRTLLVGDAANLADPWLGEGISYALASGRMAAETLINQTKADTPDLSGYSRQVKQTFLKPFQFARKMALLVSLFYYFNVHFLKRSPTLQTMIIDLLRGEISYQDIWRTMLFHAPRAFYQIIAEK